MTRTLVLALLAASLAGAAYAQTGASHLTAVAFVARSAAVISHTPIATPSAQANALREAGVARTSIDRRFSRDELTGSFGFLCGLQPRLNEASGSAHGIDSHGRFLGAKFSLAFR